MYKKDLDFILKGKDIPYFFMFYGDDSYQIELYAKEYLSRFNGDKLTLSFDEYDFNRAKSQIDQNSLFGDVSILHIKTDKKILLKELKALVSLANSSAIFAYELHDGVQKNVAEQAKVFGANFARFFVPKNDSEASEILLNHAKKLGITNANPALLLRIYHIHNENVYLATSELNRIAISGLALNDELIAKLVSSLNAISFDTLFNTLLKSHDASAKIAQYFDANSIEESVFLAALYKSFYRLFIVHSGLKLKPNAKLQEFLGYALPAHVEAELKAQASRFSLPMFYDIFAHLNACDYELKKPKNFMDKELFLRSELLKLSSIIAKHSKH